MCVLSEEYACLQPEIEQDSHETEAVRGVGVRPCPVSGHWKYRDRQSLAVHLPGDPRL